MALFLRKEDRVGSLCRAGDVEAHREPKNSYANAIQITVNQKIAGTPVACDMFTASVGTVGPNGFERKKTVFRS